jgi:streptogramin lyase
MPRQPIPTPWQSTDTGTIAGIPGAVLVGGARYVTGSATGLITAFTPSGASNVFLSLPESVSNPSSLTTDLQGRLVFVGANQAWNNASIVRVSGTTLTYPVSMSRPSQVAIDALGRFVVSSSADANIRVFDPEGTLITTLPDRVFLHDGERSMDPAHHPNRNHLPPSCHRSGQWIGQQPLLSGHRGEVNPRQRPDLRMNGMGANSGKAIQ